MNKLRTKIFGAFLISIMFLTATIVLFNIFIDRISVQVTETRSYKTAAGDIVAAANSLKTSIDYYYVADENKKTAIVEENEYFIGQINRAVLKLTSRKGYSYLTDENIKAIRSINIIHDKIYDITDRLVESESNYKKIKTEVLEVFGSYDHLSNRALGYAYRIEEAETDFEFAPDLSKAEKWREQIATALKGVADSPDMSAAIKDYSVEAEQLIAASEELDRLRKHRSYLLTLMDKYILESNISALRISSSVEKELNDQLRASSFDKKVYNIAIFISFALSLVTTYFLTKNLTRSITILTNVAVEVAKGNLSTRANIKTHDEIGFLGKVLNKMLDNISVNNEIIKRTKNEVEKANQELEGKVVERTKELEKLKNNLEIMVEKRTEELNRKVEELQKFQDLTVGRELKMIQLKNELGDLRNKLNYGKSEIKK